MNWAHQGCPASCVYAPGGAPQPWGSVTTYHQCSRCPGRLLAPRENAGAVYADQRSSYQCRGCRRGFTIAGVHSSGRGRAGVGLTTVDSVTHKRWLCRPSWATGCSSTIRRPTELRWRRLHCAGGLLKTSIQSNFFILLFLRSGIF